MLNNDLDKAIELALRTWYPKGHSLHLDHRHPLGKLAEWGEFQDDYMKMLFKPGYEWDWIDELGDVWYYIRILMYQLSYNPVRVYDAIIFDNDGNRVLITFHNRDCDFLASIATYFSSRVLLLRPYGETGNRTLFEKCLDVNYSIVLEICNTFGLSLDELTAFNWEKLKPGSKRGEEWTKAREVI